MPTTRVSRFYGGVSVFFLPFLVLENPAQGGGGGTHLLAIVAQALNYHQKLFEATNG